MLHKKFDEVVRERLQNCVDTLCSKDKEYSSDTDRLHNFKKAGRMKGQDPIQALDGMWLKHRVSVDDMVEQLVADAGYIPSKELIAEKFGDNHNYLLLLEGLIEDRRELIERKGGQQA